MEDNIFNHTESTTPFFTGTPTGDTVGEINERAENENMFLVSLLFVAGAVAILVTTVFCVIYRNKIDVCLNNCGWGPPTTKQMMLRRKRRRLSSSTESTSTQPQSPSRFSFRNGLSKYSSRIFLPTSNDKFLSTLFRSAFGIFQSVFA